MYVIDSALTSRTKYSTSAVKSPVSNFIESNLLHTCSHYLFIGPTNEIRILSEYSGLPQATPLLGLHPDARWPKKTSLLSDHHAQQYGRPFQFKSNKPWGPRLYCFLDILRLRNTPEKVKVVLCTQLRLRRGGCCWWGCWSSHLKYATAVKNEIYARSVPTDRQNLAPRRLKYGRLVNGWWRCLSTCLFVCLSVAVIW